MEAILRGLDVLKHTLFSFQHPKHPTKSEVT